MSQSSWPKDLLGVSRRVAGAAAKPVVVITITIILTTISITIIIIIVKEGEENDVAPLHLFLFKLILCNN